MKIQIALVEGTKFKIIAQTGNIEREFLTFDEIRVERSNLPEYNHASRVFYVRGINRDRDFTTVNGTLPCIKKIVEMNKMESTSELIIGTWNFIHYKNDVNIITR